MSSALSPQSWCFDLAWIPQNAYLVGGAVRDALLKRESEYLDLDFVLLDAVKIARKMASYYKAGFVLLDSDRQIARVVFKQATVDFAQQQGTLEEDLYRRDFTVNAIAYNPYTQEIIDPINGYNDLQNRVMRMVSKANLQDDPLRLLRAYRQAAQLGFAIAPETQATIRSLSPLLSNIAPERVRVELNYLLNSPVGTPWLKSAWEDGLINNWLSHTTQRSYETLALIDSAALSFPQLPLFQALSNTVKTTWLGIAKKASLVSNNPEIAEIELQQLTYSRAEIRAVTTALKLLPQLPAKADNLSLKEQYLLFRQAGVVFPALAVLAAAKGTQKDTLIPLINRYLTPNDPVAHPQLLVNGKDLMGALKIAPSPVIGELLNKIAIAQIEGKISTPAQAIELATTLLNAFS